MAAQTRGKDRGAALLAQDLTTRPTEDLDFFTARIAATCPRRATRDALEAAVRKRAGCLLPDEGRFACFLAAAQCPWLPVRSGPRTARLCGIALAILTVIGLFGGLGLEYLAGRKR